MHAIFGGPGKNFFRNLFFRGKIFSRKKKSSIFLFDLCRRKSQAIFDGRGASPPISGKEKSKIFLFGACRQNRLRFSTAGEGPFFLVLFLSEKGRIFSDSFRSRGKYRKKGEFFSIPLSPENSMNFRGTLVCRRKSLAIFDGRRGSFFFQKKDGFSPNSRFFLRAINGSGKKSFGVGENIGRGKSIKIGGKPVFLMPFLPIPEKNPSGPRSLRFFSLLPDSEGIGKKGKKSQRSGPRVFLSTHEWVGKKILKKTCRTSKFLPPASAMCRGFLEFGRSRKKNIYMLRRPSFFFSTHERESCFFRPIYGEDFFPESFFSGPFSWSFFSDSFGVEKKDEFPPTPKESGEISEKGRIFPDSEGVGKNIGKKIEDLFSAVSSHFWKRKIQDFSFRRLPSKSLAIFDGRRGSFFPEKEKSKIFLFPEKRRMEGKIENFSFPSKSERCFSRIRPDRRKTRGGQKKTCRTSKFFEEFGRSARFFPDP